MKLMDRELMLEARRKSEPMTIYRLGGQERAMPTLGVGWRSRLLMCMLRTGHTLEEYIIEVNKIERTHEIAPLTTLEDLKETGGRSHFHETNRSTTLG